MNSDPTGVMLEVSGPCRSDQEATDAVRVQEEIQQFVCGDRNRYQFRLTSPTSDFFQLQTTCQNGQFRQLLQGICQRVTTD
ncbi:MAG: hypothetical protein HYY44_02860 [Deltaproteobacteria bacterium]|nr:hypothetical protein [Deltaproteobacteria bacterium]